MQIGADPCGFCGETDKCISQLLKGSKGKLTVQSTCPYRYESMRYKTAAEGSISQPCTNVPIHCCLSGCRNATSGIPRTIWKYNSIYHLVSEHSRDNATAPQIPPQMMIAMFIRKSEERSLGVHEEATRQFRRSNDIPSSDGFEMNNDDADVVSENSELQEKSLRRQRDRAETVTPSSPSKKRRESAMLVSGS